MREIMAVESSRLDQGVASFEYCPADERYPFLFEISRPLSDLGKMLVAAFAGRTLTMQEIYETHSIGKRFIKRNYKDILLQLEAEGLVSIDPPASKRRLVQGALTMGTPQR